MVSRSKTLKPLLFLVGAGNRNRTGTGITTHGILSPGRLPVPPSRHKKLEATPRFELGIKDLQSSALPLGYAASFDGAEDGIRTRDFRLGKATLYH